MEREKEKADVAFLKNFVEKKKNFRQKKRLQCK